MSDKDIFATKESFLVAAASYFGLPDDQLMQGSTVEVGRDGSLDVVLRVALTPDDITGIAGRMKALHADAVAKAHTALTGVAHPPSDDLRPTVGWTDAELREQYDALDRAAKSQYGSFHRYKAWRQGMDLDATITGKVELPPYVYLSPAEATEQQKVMAIGRDEKGNYAIAVEYLTPSQWAKHVTEPEERRLDAADQLRAEMDVHLADGAGESLNPGAAADNMQAEYVQRTMAAHARLNGDDGKPTSNADDFGGVPG